ncbi:MAG: hypothetical protein JEZ04_12590 [Spirochaetales bacterium]|nr:hypothetical protein [Spirochaetales bacterium]
MLVISPDDSELVKEFLDKYFGENKMMSAMSLDAPEVVGVFTKIKIIFSMLPMILSSKNISRLTIQDFAARFKSSFLSRSIRYLIDTPGWPMPKFPLMMMIGQAGSVALDFRISTGRFKKGCLWHSKTI